MSKTLTNHGGDIYTEGVLKGKKLRDFSSNINLVGVPESFYKGVEEALKYVNCYPDIEYRETKRAIIDYHKLEIENENILLGNGAAEVLDLAISRVKSLCIIAPSFSEYTLSAKKYGIEITHSYLTEDMEYDYDDILEKLKAVEGLIIANPNNPNGRGINREAFKSILDFCEENGKLVIIDEAFVEFLGDEFSLINEVLNYKCLIIIRAITKFFALPGIRLGWAVSGNLELVNEIKELQLPWNINTFGALSLKYLLSDEEYIERSVKENKSEREFLLKELEKLSVFERVYESKCNFVLCKLKGISDEELFKFCLNNGILIRKCGNYEGLNSSFIRVAVKSRENNEELLKVLNAFGNGEKS
ncbi:MAG: pyridoxal phosphate-dependent aminotransferase [Clostridium sp.]